MDILGFMARNKMIILILLIPLLLLFIFIRDLSVISALIIIDIILGYFMGLWHIKSIGIEFVLLASVIAGMTYGSLSGALVGFLFITIHMIATQHLNVYLLWVIPGYSIAGFTAGTTTMSITMFGIYAALALNLVNLIITAIVFRQNVGKFFPFALTNVLFNLLLFAYVAPGIMNLIS